jgi:hypothetical protein
MPRNRSRFRNVRPDTVDFRDLPFRPNIAIAPVPAVLPEIPLKIKSQGETNACTGFSLSLVVEYLLRKSGREGKAEISPYMLYSMARRYDEYSGGDDDGSSLRGALKGWFKHGACLDRLWKTGVDVPPAPRNAEEDWWLDAVRRPLGAYYRIDIRQVSDIHSALNEVGIVYASVDTHVGWDAGGKVPPAKRRPSSFDGMFVIPHRRGSAGGHAIALVGYDERGFLVQNSWGTDWGSYGFGLLTYDDWLSNAMDCWVAQLGVATEDHEAIARSSTLRVDRSKQVTLAAGDVLRNREISPFVVDMGNNGVLSDRGIFRTTPDDVRALVDIHLLEARTRWGLAGKPIDVCIYAHGGLVDEKAAATCAADWIPLLYGKRIFPIFLMWETGFLDTVMNRLDDAARGVPRVAGAGEGFWARAEKWWNRRLERIFWRPGTAIWGEMKQNAAAISANPDSGLAQLFTHFQASPGAKQPVRIHLVGHSAGSIVHSYLIDAGVRQGLEFESVSFLAPAITVDDFRRLAWPHIQSGAVKRYQQFHLSDKAEEDDPTCSPYRRSLLYLVSESFEHGVQTPILGMQRYFDKAFGTRAKLKSCVAPGVVSGSTTHGGFDDDPGTRAQVVRFIKGTK